MTLQVVLEFHLLLPFYQKIISAFQRLASSVLPAQVWYKLLQVHPHSLDQVLLKSLDPSLQIEQPCQIQIPHQVDLEGLELRVHQVVLAFPLLFHSRRSNHTSSSSGTSFTHLSFFSLDTW